MSFGKSNTETRILQMQLENKDFEEGVRQTIKAWRIWKRSLI